MLSFVSVISVNLLASLATPRVDSVRLSPSGSKPTDIAITDTAIVDELPRIERGVLATASRYIGTRYRFGGTRPSAFDCSGFVRYVFAHHGVSLPRTAAEQAEAGFSIVVGLDSVQVGDLLFFATGRGRASHVAIYAGDGRIIHASAGSKRVRYDDLASPRGRWFIEHLSSARRVIGNRESGGTPRPPGVFGPRIVQLAAASR